MSDLDPRVVALREAFDRSFAEPPRPLADNRESVLEIRVGPVQYLLASDAIRRIARCPVITTLPSAPAGLRGLVALRGRTIPAWDLASLLGLEPSPEAPAWIAIAGWRGAPVGLTFDAFEGQRSRQDERAETAPGVTGAHRQRLDVAAVLERLDARLEQTGVVTRT